MPGHESIVFDLGTGLRFWGRTLPRDGSFRATALVTHLHWDHVQGLPFLAPMHCPGSHLDIFGPRPSADVSVGEAFGEFMRPPYFPVRAAELHADIDFHDLGPSDITIGEAKVKVREVPHVGRTNGYRVELGGVSVAYISDHQQPLDGTDRVAESVLELCDGADLVIHDAQYLEADFALKRDWGHCTVDYAVHVAATAGAKRLALFHHDPSHGDDVIDRLLVDARGFAEGTSVTEVIAAAEGTTVSLNLAAASA